MKPLALALASVAFIAATAAAGIVYEIETVHQQGAPPELSHIYVDGQALRMDAPGQGPSGADSVLFSGERMEMTIVDHGQKRYSVIDEAARDRMAAQVGAAMAQYQAMLKTIPEAQRKMMEQMMPAGMPKAPPALEVRKTGQNAEHNGYPCAGYELLEDGTKTHEFWVTDWNNVPGGAETAATFKAMGDFFASVRDAMEQAGGMGDVGTDAVMTLMKEVDGYPVVTRVYDEGGRQIQETRLKSAVEKPLEPSLFEPPGDYRQEPIGLP